MLPTSRMTSKVLFLLIKKEKQYSNIKLCSSLNSCFVCIFNSTHHISGYAFSALFQFSNSIMLFSRWNENASKKMFSIATKNGSKSVHSFSKSYIPNAAIFKSPVGVIPNVVVANMCDILMK